MNAHGGVNGRKINFEVLDDAYDPSQTVPLTQQLVEQNRLFADFGSLGTAPNLAIWGYLNQHKVPQVLIATGDSYWGFSAKKYPWTIGYQPDYPGEGKVYGKYIAANMPNAKIGVLYQNDAFGKNYFAGLRVGLGAKKSQIVASQSYDPTQTSLVQQILALKAAGADTFVIFALPTQAITALVTATKVGWTPTTFLGNVSANPVFLRIAAQNGATVDGVISTNYLVDPTLPSEANLAGVKLAKAIIGTVRAAAPAEPQRGRLERRLRPRRGVDVRLCAPARGQEPDAREPHAGAEEHEQRDRPVPLPGDQDQHVGDGQLPDRAGDPHQVGRWRHGRLGRLRQALQQRPLGRPASRPTLS